MGTPYAALGVVGGTVYLLGALVVYGLGVVVVVVVVVGTVYLLAVDTLGRVYDLSVVGEGAEYLGADIEDTLGGI